MFPLIDRHIPSSTLPTGNGCLSTGMRCALHAGASGSYVNFMTETDEERVRATYAPACYARLTRIKGHVRPG